jgi:hypothetical protein
MLYASMRVALRSGSGSRLETQEAVDEIPVYFDFGAAGGDFHRVDHRETILFKDGPKMKTSHILIIATVFTTFYASAAAKTIYFAGYHWTVKSGGHLGPGPNSWDEDNVWVDQEGYLHLALTNRGGQWYCSEVSMADRLGFGHYQFWLVGRIDRLDPNVVFGLFSYPTPDVGPDGTHEIDIEFSMWGRQQAPIGNYTVWPAKRGLTPAHKTFPVELNGDYTTQRFIRSAASVMFESLRGHRDDEAGQFATWLYQPADPASYVGDQPLPVQINLWLFRGQPPQNGQEVELIVRSFKFTPDIANK